MTRRRIVVTGLGIISAAGCGIDEVWPAVRAGRSGLRPLTLFPSPRHGHVPVGQVQADVERLAGNVRGSRSDKLAWIAAREAVAQAGGSLPANRLGIVLGATVGGMPGTERFLAARLEGRPARYGPLRFHECSASADLLARQLGARGPVLTFSTACSSGALALAVGGELIASGDADAVLAGGGDALCRLTVNGFGSLLLLDPQGCRPFDAARAGISLGEGAAVLVLEAAETAAARGATALAALAGWGASCDAFHATAPRPDGRGALAAMQRALARAGLAPADVGYVNAHGTGTRDNDLMEGRALRQLFGDAVPPVSSTKRCFGHTLGASGALKAAVCVMALRDQVIPPNPGFDTVDPAIGVAPVRAPRPATLSHALTSSFGFGGNNVALVFSRPALATAPPPAAAPRRVAIVGAGVAVPGPAGGFGAEGVLSPARRRRLSRLQQLTLVAARQCLPPGVDPARTCVAIGTALGALNEATAFVENLLAKSEAEPLPQRFTNAVHNALAAQVAIEFGCQGLNSTPTCHEISFEVALWHALLELRAGAATAALAGVAEELNPYALDAARRWQVPPLTEGAAVFCLASEPWPAAPLAQLVSVRLGADVTPAALPPGIELLVTNAPAAVTGFDGAVLANRTGSGFGFKLALDRIRAGCRRAALYTVSPHGQKALCCLEA